MKTIPFALLFALCVGCSTFVPKHATPTEEYTVAPILQEAGCVLLPGSTDYFTKTFDQAEFYYGKAYKNGVLGWFVIELVPVKGFAGPPGVHWSADGQFPELELDALVTGTN